MSRLLVGCLPVSVVDLCRASVARRVLAGLRCRSFGGCWPSVFLSGMFGRPWTFLDEV